MTRSEKTQSHRVEVGDQFPRLELTTITDESILLPDGSGVTHLQFRRFAGCPICNLHLRSITNRLGDLEAHGIREVVLFHSTQAELRKYENDLPMAVIADPQRALYERFGVEASPRALLQPGFWKYFPHVWWNVLRLLRRVVKGRAPFPVKPTGGQLGLPADVLVGSDGTVIAVKYGEHAFDQWSVDEILGHAAVTATSASRVS